MLVSSHYRNVKVVQVKGIWILTRGWLSKRKDFSVIVHINEAWINSNKHKSLYLMVSPLYLLFLIYLPFIDGFIHCHHTIINLYFLFQRSFQDYNRYPMVVNPPLSYILYYILSSFTYLSLTIYITSQFYVITSYKKYREMNNIIISKLY